MSEKLDNEGHYYVLRCYFCQHEQSGFIAFGQEILCFRCLSCGRHLSGRGFDYDYVRTVECTEKEAMEKIAKSEAVSA